MSTVVSTLSRWLPDSVTNPDEYASTYHNDIKVLASYLERIYGAGNSRLVLDSVPYADDILASIAALSEVLQFPLLSGYDSREPETAEWASFVARRAVEIHPDIPVLLGRFESDTAVKRLLSAGVPLAYAKALDITHWGEEYPADAVLAAWQAHLAPEYARAIVFGES